MKYEILFADRIGGVNFGKSTEIYKFEKIKRAKAKARELHPDLEMKTENPTAIYQKIHELTTTYTHRTDAVAVFCYSCQWNFPKTSQIREDRTKNTA